MDLDVGHARGGAQAARAAARRRRRPRRRRDHRRQRPLRALHQAGQGHPQPRVRGAAVHRHPGRGAGPARPAQDAAGAGPRRCGAAARAGRRPGERRTDRGQGGPLRPLRHRRHDERVAPQGLTVEDVTDRAGRRAARRPPGQGPGQAQGQGAEKPPSARVSRLAGYVDRLMADDEPAGLADERRADDAHAAVRRRRPARRSTARRRSGSSTPTRSSGSGWPRSCRRSATGSASSPSPRSRRSGRIVARGRHLPRAVGPAGPGLLPRPGRRRAGRPLGPQAGRWSLCDLGRGRACSPSCRSSTPSPAWCSPRSCSRCSRCMWSPAKEASVPNLVQPEFLANANSLSLVAAYGTFPLGGVLFTLSAKVAVWLGNFERAGVAARQPGVGRDLRQRGHVLPVGAADLDARPAAQPGRAPTRRTAGWRQTFASCARDGGSSAATRSCAR